MGADDVIPTFSISMESENLLAAEIDDLWAALDSLKAQGPLVEKAESVILAHTGGLDDSALDKIARDYPWLTVRQANSDGYIGQKEATFGAADSEVMVVCDSDLVYQKGWLEHLLLPLARDPSIALVGGETTTRIRGPYELAVALTYVFPPFSDDAEPVTAKTYWANNVAVRRSLVEKVALPDPEVLYRGQNILHAAHLQQHGVKIWRAPKARGLHASPLLSEVSKRYFRLGRDSVNIPLLCESDAGISYRGDMEPDLQSGSRMAKLINRARIIFGRQPKLMALLPLAAPVLLYLAACYYSGRWSARRGASSLGDRKAA